MTPSTPSPRFAARRPRRLSSLGLLSLSAATAFGQTIWSGGGADNLWSTGANWQGGDAPVSSATTDVQFDAVGTTPVGSYVDSPYTLRLLKFNSGSFVLGGEEISLHGTGVKASDDLLLNFTTTSGSAYSQTINNNLRVMGMGAIRTVNSNLTLNGDIVLNNISQLQVNTNAGRTTHLNGVISGTVTNLIYTGHVNGTGRTRINAANTYVGNTIIWTGGVVVNVDAFTTGGAFGQAATAISVGPNSSGTYTPSILTGAAVEIARDIRLVSNLTGTTNATLGGDTAHTSVYSGAVIFGTNNAAAAGVTLTAAEGGRVRFTGGLQRATGATGFGDTVVKTGAGTVSIEGSGNSYLGATTVNQGAFLVNGVLQAGGQAVTVKSGALLGGEGEILRDVVIESGAIFSAGDISAGGVSQAGGLVVGGDLTFGETSVLRFDLGSTSDFVSVGGDLTLRGRLEVTSVAGFGYGVYPLFSYGGSLLANELVLDSLPEGYTYGLIHSGGQVSLQVIPEPAAVAMLAGVGVLGFAALRRRRVR